MRIFSLDQHHDHLCNKNIARGAFDDGDGIGPTRGRHHCDLSVALQGKFLPEREIFGLSKT
jgi:hypothetical protein